MINEIITYLIYISGFSVVVIFLAKIITGKILDLGIEKYKSKLNSDLEDHKSKLNLALESYRGQLKITELEHQIKYNRLHEERAVFLKSFYTTIVELKDALYNLTTPAQGPNWTTDQERENNAWTAIRKANREFQFNKILINSLLCEKIESILNASDEIISQMSYAKELGSAHQNETKREALQEWRAQFKKVRNDIEELKVQLEIEFRTLLGVE